MSSRNIVLASVGIVLLGGILAGHLSAARVAADSTTSLVVYHRTIYCTEVATDYYNEIQVIAWQYPSGSSADVTSTGQSYTTCSEGTHGWLYSTTLSGSIRFEVTIDSGKDGTICGGASTDYWDDDELFKIVSEGDTGSLTAGWYRE